MPQRIGILRVTVDNGIVSARVEGQLSMMEWTFALDMTKSRILAGQAAKSPLDLIPRKVDSAEVR